MKFTGLFLIVFYLNIANCPAQKVISLVDNIITVNTRHAPVGNTDVIEVSLPAKTQSFIYRISLFKKDQWSTVTSLSALLDSMGAKNISNTTDFRQFALPNSNNATGSGFIFTNPADSDNFYEGKTGWRACKNILRLTNTCQFSQQCLGKKLYFGFSNADADEELDIRLEVVAVVD